MAYRISLKWLNAYLPRSLHGRAALILILPIILLQLTVTIVFVQRHFEGVTEQMTRSVTLDLQYLVDGVNVAPNLADAQVAMARVAEPLQLTSNLPAADMPSVNQRRWYDFTGAVVERTLRDNIAGLGAVVLPDNSEVVLWFDTVHGEMRVTFGRGRVSASNPHQLLVWMVVLGVAMTMIAYIYLRKQLTPITQLAAAAADYGRGRVVSYRPRGATEVRAAGNAFLDMRNRIERQTQTRTMMLSGVSHDLRTPLTRLRLGLGMLDGDDVDPLIRDVDDMQMLLDAFLDFARGEAEGDAEPVEIAVFAQQILADAKRMGQAVSAGEMECGAGEEGIMSIRALAIKRAIENLIGNALRYGAEARFSVVMSPKAVVFTVEDDGPGIPPDLRDDAVRPFMRLDPARNQNLGSGVGLGLAIVEDIARAHGGTLRLGESEVLGGLKAEVVLGR